MNKNDIKIICDSIANMPNDLAEKYDIEIVPVTIIVDGKEFKENTISNEEFYDMIRKCKEIPKTSQATYVDFKEVFDKYANDGKKILYIGGSSKSSGTYQSGVLASKDVEGEVYTFDSMNICFGCGMLVVEAAKMAEQGKSIEEILSKLEEMKDEVFISMSMNTLEYLKKGGRISNTKALVGNLLNIKPMLTVKDGLVYQEGQVRGSKKIIPTIIKRTIEECGQDFSDKSVVIACGDNVEDVEKLKEAISKELNPKEIVVININPPMTINIGPEFIGITCFK